MDSYDAFFILAVFVTANSSAAAAAATGDVLMQ